MVEDRFWDWWQVFLVNLGNVFDQTNLFRCKVVLSMISLIKNNYVFTKVLFHIGWSWLWIPIAIKIFPILADLESPLHAKVQCPQEGDNNTMTVGKMAAFDTNPNSILLVTSKYCIQTQHFLSTVTKSRFFWKGKIRMIGFFASVSSWY